MVLHLLISQGLHSLYGEFRGRQKREKIPKVLRCLWHFLPAFTRVRQIRSSKKNAVCSVQGGVNTGKGRDATNINDFGIRVAYDGGYSTTLVDHSVARAVL